MPKASVNIYEAKTQLSRLVDRAASGEDVIIGRGGKPIARLTRLASPGKKIEFGLLKGKVRASDDFDAPSPESLLTSRHPGEL